MPEEFFTVSELNKLIHDVVSSGFPRSVWVCGEIQGFRVDQKGHAYFELCESEEGTHVVKAKLRASIWSSRRPSIEATLKRVENAFELKNEILVKCLCRVDFWEKAGSLSLIVEAVDPTYTLGKIAQERQKLIALLTQSGTLGRNKQLALPLVALNIGLITSADSAAYNDFIDELKRSGFGFKVVLANSTMQGKTAETSVCRALALLQDMGLDAIVITRGGGSVAELACFDSKMIAEAIAASRLPVLTGIGHEINTTITDLAAHTYAKTPTAMAQFLVDRVRAFLLDLQTKRERMLSLALETMDRQNNRLRTRAMQLQTDTMGYFRRHLQMINRFAQELRRLPQQTVKESQRALVQRRADLVKIIQLRLTTGRTKIGSYQKLIELASPVNTLKRGFTITRGPDGRAVRNVRQVKAGEVLTTLVVDGHVVSTVEKISKGV